MYCRHCGQKLSDNAAFCSSCGASVNGEAPKSQKEKPRPRNHRNINKKAVIRILLIALFVAALVVVLVVIGWKGISTMVLPDPVYYFGISAENVEEGSYSNTLELIIDKRSEYAVEAIDSYIQLLKTEYGMVATDDSAFYDFHYSPYAALDKNHFHKIVNGLFRDDSPYHFEIKIYDKQYTHIAIVYGDKVQFAQAEEYSWDAAAAYEELDGVSLPNPALFMGVDTPFPDRFLSGFEVYDPDREMLNAYIDLLCDNYEMEIYETESDCYRLRHRRDADYCLLIAVDDEITNNANTYYTFSGNCSVVDAEVYDSIP